MKHQDYTTPKIMEVAIESEPVETGCCLRSCGGSPNHLNHSNADDGLLKKLEEVK